MKKSNKEYQVWEFSDGGYNLTEFDTAEEAMESQKYTSDWYLTKAINKISVYTSFEKEKK